ncbi:hypothetical protein ACHAXS_000878 [Conticribra weissflogii]
MMTKNDDGEAWTAPARASLSVVEYQLLKALSWAWTEHRFSMGMVRDIFMYMDRTYIPVHKRRPVFDLGLWLFRWVVWEARMDGDQDDGHNGKDRLYDLKSPPEWPKRPSPIPMTIPMVTTTLGNVTSSPSSCRSSAKIPLTNCGSATATGAPAWHDPDAP